MEDFEADNIVDPSSEEMEPSGPAGKLPAKPPITSADEQTEENKGGSQKRSPDTPGPKRKVPTVPKGPSSYIPSGYPGPEFLENVAKMAATPEAVQISCGEALRTGDSFPQALRNTLESPTVLSAEASLQRNILAAKAGVLEIALDAAMTIGAQNSMEKMLAHQMSVAHRQAMHFGLLSLLPTNSEARIRLLKASSVPMRSFQQGMDCISRARRAGHPIVTAQNVTVNEGGQAIVAAKIHEPSK